MDQDSVFALIRPQLADLIEDVRATFHEFDTLLPVDYRLTIERARPKVMHLRILSRWLRRYGTSGSTPIRVTEDEYKLKYLFMQGDDFSVGLRHKRLREDGVCSQHVSKRQTSLRQTDSFPEFKMHVAHVFLGYRFTGGENEVEPRLTDISLSSEYVTPCGGYDVRWRQPIWNADEGMEPVRPIQPTLLPPPPPVIRPRRRAEGETGEGTQQQSG